MHNCKYLKSGYIDFLFNSTLFNPLTQDIKNTSNNRGFAFIDYYNNACADYSRQKMMSPTFKLDDNSPTVSWADPKNADSSASSQVEFHVFLILSDVENIYGYG